MPPVAFVYTELHDSRPFDTLPWTDGPQTLAHIPGGLDKTWLAGLGNTSIGGIYSFDSLRSAQDYVTNAVTERARTAGLTFLSRIFDASAVNDASLEMNSPHFGATLSQSPGAFVYVEMQINLPFDQAPWRDRNPVLLQVPGLLAKTWLSGRHTNTLGGFYAFDTIANASEYALSAVPKTAAVLKAAPYVRVFDATVTETANIQFSSPFYR
jgi:hypothetical protein